MSLYFDNLISEALIVLIVLLITVYFYFKNEFKYWESRGIPTLPPSFPFGNAGTIVARSESIGKCFQRTYNKFSHTNKFVGFYLFNKPSLVVTDPEEIKNIFVRDFSHFHDRGVYYNEKDDPLSAHLFAIEGNKWRNLRMKLSPTFTSGKMKYMFPTIRERAEHLSLFLKDAITKDSTIEMKDVLARFTTDVIGTCAFGIECNSLKDPNTEFRRYGQRIFKRTFIQTIKFPIISVYKDLSRKLGMKSIDSGVSNFFMNVVKETVKYREENNIKRNDFMDLLIQLKNNGTLEGNESENASPKSNSELTSITIEEAAAQAFVFFFAGFETSSVLMSFCLYELALNSIIQEKTREEITSVLLKYEGKVTYEAIMDMPYMNQVIEETLRKYPTIPLLVRSCTKDYKLPDSDVVITKGTRVWIPILGLQHDPKYYPDPKKFDPDRFTTENKAKRHQYTYLPFGEGPRICIGMRFAMMQTRLGLISILRNFNLKNTKTPVPLIIDPKSPFSASVGGILLDLTLLDH